MISLVFAAALLAGAPAAGEPAQAATATTPAKANPDEMVCKRQPVLGSRMEQRICMTRRDWEAREHHDREDLDKSQLQQPQRPG